MIVAALLVALVSPAANTAEPPPVRPTPATLRLALVHTGAPGPERLALVKVVREGAWPGNPSRPLDDTNLGAYRFEVRDPGSGRVLYSRGYSSVYGEWEATEEAKTIPRAFHESLRFPAPEAPVQVVISRRGSDGGFRSLFELALDPASPAIELGEAAGGAWPLFENGPPASKVDLLLLGDGYRADEMEKWHRDARRLAELLFAVSPFKERRGDFNLWAVDTPSAVSGVSKPSDGLHRRSALRAAYDALGSERYVLALDDARLREAAAAAPYDALVVVVNERKYGGGGVFGLFSTVAADNAFAPYLLVHEFAHHFAGLADEYYTSDVAYAPASQRIEPWEPNVSASATAPKWRALVRPGTPLPTPWSKEAFETLQREIQARRKRIRAERRPEEEMEALFREEQQRGGPLLAAGAHAHDVGAFEGANYEATGYFRPQASCLMFTRGTSFCAVCRRAIERAIDLYAGARP
jgi:hypothetical protein